MGDAFADRLGGITPDLIVDNDTLTTGEFQYLRAVAPKTQEVLAMENDLALELSKTVQRGFVFDSSWRDEYFKRIQGLGLPVNLKRVARLMREAGIQGLYRRRRRGCTVRDSDAQACPDLVNRDFSADEPNRLWITDITEHPTGEGKVYCAAVMDVYSRLIVGWSIAEHMRTELVTDALGMAIVRRRPEKKSPGAGTIMHSDHGSQYFAIHVMGVRATHPHGRVARFDGFGR